MTDDMDPGMLAALLRAESTALDAANARADQLATRIAAAKAAVRLMQPDHLTPTGARHILSTLEPS